MNSPGKNYDYTFGFYTFGAPPGDEDLSDSLSVRGMEMMTPFPVPIHRRLHDTMRAVILTKEKPSLPVPDRKE